MPEEEHAATALMGGLMTYGYQCGMLWGAALGAGAQAYRLHGPGVFAQAVSVVAAHRLVESFGNYNKGDQLPGNIGVESPGYNPVPADTEVLR